MLTGHIRSAAAKEVLEVALAAREGRTYLPDEAATRAYEKGKAAAAASPVGQNPYRHTRLAFYWDRGWIEANKEKP